MQPREGLLNELDEQCVHVGKIARRYRNRNAILLLTALLCGLLATVLAGDSASGGKVIAARTAEITTGKTPSELPNGWKNVCGLIAIITFIGTAATTANSWFKIAENQSRATICAGLLHAMRLELMDEETSPEATKKIKDDLLKIFREYPEFFLEKLS